MPFTLTLNNALFISLLPFFANLLLLRLSVRPTWLHVSLLTLLPFATILLLETLAALHFTGIYALFRSVLGAIAAALVCLIVTIIYLSVPLILTILITIYHYEAIDIVSVVQSMFSQPLRGVLTMGVTSCLSLPVAVFDTYMYTPLTRLWHTAESLCSMCLAPIPIILFSWILDQLTVLVCEPWKHTQSLAELVRSILWFLRALWTEFGRGVMWLGWGEASDNRPVSGLILVICYFIADVKLTIARSAWKATAWVLSRV